MGRKHTNGLPTWAKNMWEELGSPELEGMEAVTSGDLLDRRYGLRRDDLVEMLLDARALPDDKEPWLRGRLVSSGKMTVEILAEDGKLHYISRDVIVEVILVAHMRPAYLDDVELMAFEREDMKRRNKLNEKVEKEGEGRDDTHLWG
ncbi:MAG: hypothetical protein QF707_08880 [Candidatus Poseidoniaceae archaeon]|nr:hypothetical protein [Candidatus Poseidoniaceae archaeon]